MYAVEGGPRRRWPRILLWTLVAMVVVVVLASGAAYLWLDMLVGKTHGDKDAIDAIHNTSVPEGQETYDKPGTQDILVLGSDKRPGEGEPYGRSDTIMIVHVDAEDDFISVLSLPRDLRVYIEGHGRQKINAAYAYGGTAKTIETVEVLTHLQLDSYVNIDFDAFRNLTTKLGGIWVDVDRQYYNVGAHDYEYINLKPGYQALEGEAALDYVRFRHDTSGDYGRIERQQRFLRAAREQAFKSKLGLAWKIPSLASTVAANVTTELTTNEIIQLAAWGIGLDGKRIKQVTLETTEDTVDGVAYVFATEQAMLDAIRELTHEPSAQSADSQDSSTSKSDEDSKKTTTTKKATTTLPRVDLSGVTLDVLNGNGRDGEAAAAAKWLKTLGAQIGKVGDAASDKYDQTTVFYPSGKKSKALLVGKAAGTTTVKLNNARTKITLVLGADFDIPADYRPPPNSTTIPNAGEWKALATMRPFQLMAPGSLPEGYKYKDRRIYDIDTGKSTKPALKMVYQHEDEDQYLGIMETTYTDAPAAGRGEEVKVGDTTFTIVGISGKVDHIWWKKGDVLYWVSNTLSYLLGRDELLSVAKSMIDIPRSSG